MNKIKNINIKKNKELTNKFHDTRYYKVLEDNIENYGKYEKDKKKIRTQKNETITEKISEYKKLLKKKSKNLAYKLKRIYKKNQDNVYYKKKIVNGNLLKLLANLPMLMISYKKIRKNTGAMTAASIMSEKNKEKLTEEQRTLYNETITLPDGMSKEIFLQTIKLLKKNKYPWGTSKRIYVEKPGTTKKRPITIPPFMDKVIQQGIKTILETIYEPEFDKYNCSFGFRPRKSSQNAIFTVTNKKSTGLWNVIEGDIKSAYDKVNRKRLIKILEKKIKDKKFIKLIKKRLQYSVFDEEKNKYIKEKEGLPQGGIDSPYLWNIYFHEFDKHIKNNLRKEIKQLNIKRRGKQYKNTKGILSQKKKNLNRKRSTLREIIKIINNKKETIDSFNQIMNKYTAKQIREKYKTKKEFYYIKEIAKELNWNEFYKENKHKNETKIFKYKLIKLLRKMNHYALKIPTTHIDKIKLRFIYTRYADDFILLTNFNKQRLEKLKLHLKDWLEKNLNSELELNKTKITNIKKESAKFLGFELKMLDKVKTMKVQKTDPITKEKTKRRCRTTGYKVSAIPDRERLIKRFEMKGFCNNKGIPKEIPKLTTLSVHMIIERFNQIIRGFALYYTEFIRSPKTNLNRWIYILRYSCIKTIAQKEKTNIKGIFNKYKYTKHKKFFNTKENTISANVTIKLDKEEFKKSWILLTKLQAIQFAKQKNILKQIEKQFKQAHKKRPVKYQEKKLNTDILENSERYIEKINWINLRTQASFDLCCCICGETKDIQMHHIKAIRKRKQDLIKEPWEKIMGYLNRNQIPVCKYCHIQRIHRGKYGGHNLKQLIPKKNV
jgi:retron-type reverse transcriptase